MKFVLIDDDEVFLELHQSVIRESGLYHSPVSFLWASEALAFLMKDSQENPNEFYFLLLDINMPIMNGWEMLDALCKTRVANRVMVALVTSSINQDDKEKAQEYMQVVKYIEKPLKIGDIHAWLTL